MKIFNGPFGIYRLLLAFGIILGMHACKESPKVEPKPWHHKEVMPEKLKWFLNSDHYTDSNYKERFETFYANFLKEGHTDSALFCLLAYGEMIDQNYLYDTFYLSTAIHHLNKYEANSEVPGEITKLYYYIGSQYEANSDNKLAIDWFIKGMEHPNALPRTKIKCMGMLSNVYKNDNKPEMALPLQLERLNYYEKEKDTINIGVTYSNIAGIYHVLNADVLAIEYNQKGMHYSRLKNDTNTLIPMITNYIIYKKSSKTDFKITSDILAFQKELNAICASYTRLSPYNEWVRLDINFDIYSKQNKLDSLKMIIGELQKLNEILNNPSFVSKTQYLDFVYKNKVGQKITNTSELEVLANNYFENEMLWEARRIYISLYTYEKNNKNFEKALDLYEKIFDIELMWQKKNNKGQVYEMDVKYQTEKKNQEILLQAEQLKNKQSSIGLLLSSLIFIGLSFLIYFMWQKKKSINEKRKYEMQFTQKLMENTEDERKRIAKDLHDSVGHELLSIKKAISNKLLFTEDKIDHILEEVREISRNLFPVMFEEVGLKISLEQLAENIYNTDHLYVGYEIDYISGTLDIKSELQVYRIVQEALNNTRKYAQAKSAKISIQQSGTMLKVEIKDNGIGFDVEKVLKSGNAFGLLAIKQRAKSLQATTSTESNSSGTTITIEIPIKKA